jgi:hypothetical protein
MMSAPAGFTQPRKPNARGGRKNDCAEIAAVVVLLAGVSIKAHGYAPPFS